jgi:tetratricopeptide (TPR) repeat protein
MEALLTLRKLAKHKQGEFKIIMHEEASADMFRVICENPEDFCNMLAQLTRGIDVESSQCSFEEERCYILNYLEQNLGTFDMLNCNLASIMEDWAFDALRKMAEDIAETGDETEVARFRLHRAKIFSDWGRYEEALQQRELYLEAQFKALDEHYSMRGSSEIAAVVLVPVMSFTETAAHESMADASKEMHQCFIRTVAVADAMMAVAATYEHMNRFRDALQYQQEAEKYYKRVLHEDDLKFARITACIAHTYFNLDCGAMALQLLHNVLEHHRRVLPAHDPRVLSAESAIAAMHRGMQDFDSALEIEERVLDARLKNLPENHEDIGSSHFNIAVTLPFVAMPQPERNSGILGGLESALRVWKFGLKPSDPRVLLAKQKLALFQESLKQSLPDGSARE